MTQVIKLVDKDIKTAFTTMLYMLKRAEEGVRIPRREKKNMKKETKLNFLR